MKKNNMTRAERDSYEANKSLRRTWGEVKPVTRVIPDKRGKAPKHKGRQYED